MLHIVMRSIFCDIDLHMEFMTEGVSGDCHLTCTCVNK